MLTAIARSRLVVMESPRLRGGARGAVEGERRRLGGVAGVMVCPPGLRTQPCAMRSEEGDRLGAAGAATELPIGLDRRGAEHSRPGARERVAHCRAATEA